MINIIIIIIVQLKIDRNRTPSSSRTIYNHSGFWTNSQTILLLHSLPPRHRLSSLSLGSPQSSPFSRVYEQALKTLRAWRWWRHDWREEKWEGASTIHFTIQVKWDERRQMYTYLHTYLYLSIYLSMYLCIYPYTYERYI